MSDTNGVYKRGKPRKKIPAARHVTVSEDAKRAYEQLVKAKDERDKNYTRHLSNPDVKS
jgi:hypothetical protein